MCYYNSRQLGLLQITTSYYNLQQLGYYNSRQQLLQFTIGVRIHDQCYLRQVLQLTTEHTYPSSWRVCIGNYFQLKYAVSIPEKISICLNRLPRGIDGRLLYPASRGQINFFCSVSEVRSRVLLGRQLTPRKCRLCSQGRRLQKFPEILC